MYTIQFAVFINFFSINLFNLYIKTKPYPKDNNIIAV